MNAATLRRRLTYLEVPLLIICLAIFFVVTDRKEIGYAAGLLLGIGFLGLAFFRPRYGLICAMVLLFTELTINVINQLADEAVENDLGGLPTLVQTMWFAWSVLIIFAVILLAYFCREIVSGRKIRPLLGLEWAILLPLLAVITWFPISMMYEHEFIHYLMDIIPMMIFAGAVVLGRNFYREGGTREARYFILDWFILFNILILIPLWAYNVAFQPWRSALVGIASIRFGTGPYDINFYLVPLLGMILVYDDKLSLKRRRFYQLGFFLSLVRVVVSMFRGAMAGVFIALFIAMLLTDRERRRRYLKTLGRVALIGTAIFAVLIMTVPVVRATFNVALVRRFETAIKYGAGGGSLAFRQLETMHAIDEIEENLIIGYGPGKFVTKHFNARKFAQHELYLHSGYVWYLYKLGIFGLIIVAAFYTGIIGYCIKLLRRKLFLGDRGWVIGTLAAFIAMIPVVHTNNFLIRSQAVYAEIILLVGLIMIAHRYRGLPANELPAPERDEA